MRNKNVQVFRSHWFDIILTIHMSKHMRFFLSKLKVVFFFVNLDKQTLGTGVLRKKNYSLFLDCTFDRNNCYMYLFLLRKQIK